MRYGAYIFDFDFTLADASAGIIRSMNSAMEKMNLCRLSDESIKKTVGMTLKNAFRELTGNADEDAASDFLRYFKEKADEIMTDNTILFHDTITSLTQLKNSGAKTAIVTSKFNYRIKEVIKKFDITALIDYIVGFEDVSEHKPSPEGLLKAIDYLSAKKDSVLYVGDSLIDAHTAKNATVDFAAVTTGTTGRLEFQAFPHVIIADSLTEIINYAH